MSLVHGNDERFCIWSQLHGGGMEQRLWEVCVSTLAFMVNTENLSKELVF